MHPLVAPLALFVERRFGYPDPLLRTIGHPVIWMGRLIAFMEQGLNRPGKSAKERREGGLVTLLTLLLATLALTVALVEVTRWVSQGWILEALFATTLLAQKELGRAVGAVADALEVSLPSGREAVRHIVGRDPEALDEAGVARAAVETLAENASDGVIAPLFWLVLLGLPGIALYKAINTADSMIGHLDDRYRDFGWAAAKLDDLVNWIPARLTAGLFVVAAFLVRRASPTGAWRAARRDAPAHKSPNAGWPEAALAGALGFGLGGPRAYGGIVVDLAPMGRGRRDLGPADIRRALGLFRAMLGLALVLCLVQALFRF